ncbi:hypothetical protein PMIN06_006943 [Paraphaeosphaeria minitans]|uniref:DUF8004 domain-containing protein n=1 Tax=Paraphaeosphaeria minitans TaxID=565426 RepID=A0A9P6GI66_9PLEO|nr:hypothetical protein PMIN01_06855 [Paraphaeosphaeria minitans]
MRRVERWAGLTRTVSNWDGLRRDPELWDEDGDCLVHLYAVGQSQRGPSFCVPFRLLKQTNCGSMFSLCFAQTAKNPVSNNTSSEAKRLPGEVSRRIELYIPAPEDTSREGSFEWHIATRNFFAFVSGKPLVGNHLGQAMIDLQERMRLFRAGRVDNHQDFLEYAEAQGYRDFVGFPDYALAMLYYAEHYRIRDAWIDAFAHCVGMNEKLVLSHEFPHQSRLTKALITRACLEMDIELGRITSAVRDFLEDDLSPTHLGLTNGARNHLDRFRSFLHSFYVDKFGYWPPPKGTTFSKALFRSLYFDFKNLYDYLVDSESTADLASQKLASGGICVLQNVDSFDKRHRFPPLPHPLPLTPSEITSSKTKRTRSQNSLKYMTIGTKQGKDERNLSARAALIMATNGESEARIVQAYMRFERHCITSYTEEKTCIADARKVRWLLIYGTLQYLVSALRAPCEVRDTEGPKYHLNCLVREPAQWQAATTPMPVSTTDLAASPIDKCIAEWNGTPFEADAFLTKPTAIEPDCQSYDYFSHTNTDPGSRRVSIEIPAPLKISQSSRTSSVRSRRRLSLPSLGSSRNSISLKPQMHCEILVHGYGNGLNGELVDALPEVPSLVPSQHSNVDPSLTKRSSQATIGPDTSWLMSTTPDTTPHHCNQRQHEIRPCCIAIMDPMGMPQDEWGCMLELPLLINESTNPIPSHTPPNTHSPDSTSSLWWSGGGSSASSMSSTYDEQLEAKITSAEESGLLGGLVPIVSSNLASPPVLPVRRSSLPFRISRQRSSAEALPVKKSDPNSCIGVAIADPSPSAHSGLSTPVALTTSPSSRANQKISTRVSTSNIRRFPSFMRVMDVPISSSSSLEKSSTSSEQDDWPIKRTACKIDSPFVAKIKKERRLSFWKR